MTPEYPYIMVERDDGPFWRWPWQACVITGPYSHAALEIAYTRKGAIRACRRRWRRHTRPERVEL